MQVVAARKMIIGGIPYSPGDPIDTTKLTEQKVSQLLDQRILRPALDPALGGVPAPSNVPPTPVSPE